MQGKCTPEEAERFQQWSELHPGQVDEWFEKLRQQKDNDDQYTIEKTNIWQRLQPLPPGHPIIREMPPLRHRFRTIARWSVAAASIGLIISTSWWFMRKSKPANMQIAEVTLANKDTVPHRYTLPDSSTVWLNCQATLNYASDFGQKTRDIHLVGEAFFDVAKDAVHPFKVRAGSTTTIVMGTSFNIDAWPGERSVQVALVKGSVSVKTVGTPDLLLAPGEIATAIAGEKKITKQAFTVDNISAWTNGKFVFDQVALEDVMQRIEHRTGIRIKLDPKVRKRELKISGVYDLHAVSDILRSIAFVHRLRVIREAAGGYCLKE